VSQAALGVPAVVAGYLLGSVPFGVLVARRMAGLDVRQVGSGNIGATNVARAAGKGAGVLTLLLDAAKGALPVFAARWLGLAPAWVAAVGLAAFLGHLFPVWLRFRGGKGVATALGLLLALEPWAALAGLAGFAAMLALTRMVSVGSMVGAVLGAATVLAVEGVRSPYAWASAAMAGAILVRHRGNLARLARGEERRI
jgi:glycerol-3-phosphate acyltransferase PlsY